MTDDRVEEILSYFAEGNKYEGLKLKDKDFKEEELSELFKADYITCTSRDPLIYVLTIKGWRHFRGVT